MPAIKTRYGCPIAGCGAQIIAENRILKCSANPAHAWNDVAVFQGLNPQVKYEEAKPPVVAQTNHVKVEVTVPPRVKQALEAKFEQYVRSRSQKNHVLLNGFARRSLP